MNPITINRISLGSGLPKICIPITGRTEKEILSEAEALRELPHTVTEWRADFFENVQDPAAVRRVLAGLHRLLPKDLILFTFRTAKEGGAMPLSQEDYLSVCLGVLNCGMADLLDLELFTGFPEGALLSEEALSQGALKNSPLLPLIQLGHEHGMYLILSNHDFEKTPSEEVLLARFKAMEALGGDIAKIAVMPTCKKDVLTLLSASEEASRTLSCPIISMSMGKTGVISRLCGTLSGSCLTFGTAGKASAPGQVEAEKLSDILELIG